MAAISTGVLSCIIFMLLTVAKEVMTTTTTRSNTEEPSITTTSNMSLGSSIKDTPITNAATTTTTSNTHTPMTNSTKIANTTTSAKVPTTMSPTHSFTSTTTQLPENSTTATTTTTIELGITVRSTAAMTTTTATDTTVTSSTIPTTHSRSTSEEVTTYIETIEPATNATKETNTTALATTSVTEVPTTYTTNSTVLDTSTIQTSTASTTIIPIQSTTHSSTSISTTIDATTTSTEIPMMAGGNLDSTSTTTHIPTSTTMFKSSTGTAVETTIRPETLVTTTTAAVPKSTSPTTPTTTSDFTAEERTTNIETIEPATNATNATPLPTTSITEVPTTYPTNSTVLDTSTIQTPTANTTIIPIQFTTHSSTSISTTIDATITSTEISTMAITNLDSNNTTTQISTSTSTSKSSTGTADETTIRPETLVTTTTDAVLTSTSSTTPTTISSESAAVIITEERTTNVETSEPATSTTKTSTTPLATTSITEMPTTYTTNSTVLDTSTIQAPTASTTIIPIQSTTRSSTSISTTIDATITSTEIPTMASTSLEPTCTTTHIPTSTTTFKSITGTAVETTIKSETLVTTTTAAVPKSKSPTTSTTTSDTTAVIITEEITTNIAKSEPATSDTNKTTSTTPLTTTSITEVPKTCTTNSTALDTSTIKTPTASTTIIPIQSTTHSSTSISTTVEATTTSTEIPTMASTILDSTGTTTQIPTSPTTSKTSTGTAVATTIRPEILVTTTTAAVPTRTRPTTPTTTSSDSTTVIITEEITTILETIEPATNATKARGTTPLATTSITGVSTKYTTNSTVLDTSTIQTPTASTTIIPIQSTTYSSTSISTTTDATITSTEIPTMASTNLESTSATTQIPISTTTSKSSTGTAIQTPIRPETLVTTTTAAIPIRTSPTTPTTTSESTADINECSTNLTCQNGATCTNTDGSYICNCTSGWTGSSCTTDIDECVSSACANGATCINTNGSYSCICTRGWTGADCTAGIIFTFGEDANDKVLKAKDDFCGNPLTILPVPIFGRKYDTLYVCTNGLVSFQKEYTNPNPSADVKTYLGHSFLAPYYTDFDTTKVNNSGKVYYQLYDVLKNKLLLNNTNVLKAQKLLNELEGVEYFKATMIFIATWYKNSPYPADKRSNENATFQLVLATDGYNTFVMYTYFPGQINLRQNNVFIGYHFNTGEFKTHLSSFTSQAANIDMHVDTKGYAGLILYRLTSQETSLSNFDLQCLEWFESNQESQDEYNKKVEEMPKCPCNRRWIAYDPWFIASEQNFFNDVNTSCTGMAPSFKFNPHGKVCCFDTNTGGFLSDWPRAGGFLKFHPTTRKREFESEDLRMKQICCEKSDYCHLYYALRPVGDCYSDFPYDFALSWGDPHIETLDSKTYTFNGWGEFTLISLKTENASFILQARTDKARNKNGTLIDATVFTAFAARDNNNASIHVEISAERNGTYIYGNGIDYSVARANLETDVIVSTENLTITRANDTNTLKILFPSTGQPVSLNVTVGAEMLTLAVIMPPIFKNKTKGLLGNYDGDPNNDFIYPNGTVLDGNATERTLFSYGNSWTIDDSESLFTYPKGKTHADFDHRNITPKFFDEATKEQLQAAYVYCGNNTECSYDYIMTNSEHVASNTKTVQEKVQKGRNELSNAIPSLRIEGITKLNVTRDETINLKFSATDDGPVTFHFEANTVDAKFVYTDSKSAEVNFTLGRADQCELSITAQDEQGYFAPPIIFDLNICDGCSDHGRCDFDTNQRDNGTCSLKILKCICEPYWEGSSCQLDFNGCKGSPCSLNRSCTDVEASEHKKTGVSYMCSPCPQGYMQDGDKCLDIDECSKTRNECNQKCINSEGSFSCECEEGFELSTDRKTCEDIDECERNLHNCEQTCTNGIGNFTCGCFPGFNYNVSMRVCIRTVVPDVCERYKTDCNQTAGCTSNNGTAMCFCAKGFILSTEVKTCLDIDECASSPCSQSCSNFDGGFSCHCFQGYELDKDKRTCVECKYPKYGNYCQETCNCGTHGVRCDPVKGCQCEIGWEGKDCQQDINECAQDPNNCSDPNSFCQNLAGTYTCRCVSGFRMYNGNICQDIDECSDSYFNNCSQLCTNTLGGFTCGCKMGYQLHQGDQYKCIDVDECNIGTSGCEHICENTPGLYNCYCKYGYKLRTDRKTCEKEEDICAKVGHTNCSQICLVENGKAKCECKKGYFIDTDNRTCKDINECEKNTSCSQPRNCVNTNGSFSCSCDEGYRLDNDGITCRACDEFHYGTNCNNTCNCSKGADTCDKIKGCVCKPGWQGLGCANDVNECHLNNSLCPGKNYKCINTLGSYRCTCEQGYIPKNSTSSECTDVNECENSMQNTCDQKCNNTDGSYACSCNEGFILKETRCIDVNECERPNTCQHICNNLQGSYRCLCHTGFKVDVGDKSKCKPITECPQNETELCASKGAQCAVSRGQAVCQCSKGFEWHKEKRDCIDIIDCNSNARCSQKCIEGIGGYTCACSDGYRLLQNNITCVACDNNTYGAGCKEQCQCVHNNAANETQTCNHVNGTCTCKNGWKGICDVDIDECTRNTHRCREIPNTGCHNMIGGYECSCLKGYVRQNNRCVADTSNTSTSAPPPQVDETVVVMSVKLDVPLQKGVNLNVIATYEYFSNAAKVALVGFYRQKMMDNLKRIVILSLASGSLIVDYHIYTFNTPDVVAHLTVTNVELASGASVLFENSSVGVLDVRVAGIVVLPNPSDEELCKIFHLSSATCKDGYICKVTDGLPACRKNDNDEYYLTTALAAGIPMAVLVIVALIVFICFIKRRKRTDGRDYDNLRGNFHVHGERTYMHPGRALSGGEDDSYDSIPWQISASDLFPHTKCHIKRPAVEEQANPMYSVAH